MQVHALFQLGNSITVDPASRKVTHIDGVPVKDHTALMQAFADQALADMHEPDPAITKATAAADQGEV